MYPNKLIVMRKSINNYFLSVRIIYHSNFLNNGDIYFSKKKNNIITIK